MPIITRKSIPFQQFNYDEFTGQHITAGGAIEIVTVDPNADGFDTDSEDDDDVDEEDLGDSGVHNGLLEFDRQSQCSNMTFRTRTDSSSIGDYESHTSDYDDDDDDDDDDDYDEDDDEDIIAHNYLNGSMGNIQGPVVAVAQSLINPNKSILDIDAGLVGPDDILLDTRPFQKNRTMSTNTINSDVDGLGLNIDANNFDLAEFITKDDFTINPEPENITSIHNTNAASLLAANGSTTTQQSITQVISSKLADSDSDSDVIVDVETVEADDDDNVISLRKASELLKPQVTQIAHLEEEIPFVDNTTTDPSWCPERTAVKKAEVTKPEVRIICTYIHNTIIYS